METLAHYKNYDPDAVFIIAGDFNHADLKLALPKFTQHITCATRGDNKLDKAYFNIKMALSQLH